MSMSPDPANPSRVPLAGDVASGHPGRTRGKRSRRHEARVVINRPVAAHLTKGNGRRRTLRLHTPVTREAVDQVVCACM